MFSSTLKTHEEGNRDEMTKMASFVELSLHGAQNSCINLASMLKGTYYAKFTYTRCLNINGCWQCVNNHPIIAPDPLSIKTNIKYFMQPATD